MPAATASLFTTGSALRAARVKLGLNQTELARKARIGRHAVSYWECRDCVKCSGWAAAKMIAVLEDCLPDFRTTMRARGDGVLSVAGRNAAMDLDLEAKFQQWLKDKAIREAATRRVACGARTRKATPAGIRVRQARSGASSMGPRAPAPGHRKVLRA